MEAATAKWAQIYKGAIKSQVKSVFPIMQFADHMYNLPFPANAGASITAIQY